MLACRRVEERRDLRRVLALASAAVAEARVAQAAGTGFANTIQDSVAPFRELLAEPTVEELIERLRKIGTIIDQLPVWPFDAGTLKGVVAAYAVPIGAGVYPTINFILEHLR